MEEEEQPRWKNPLKYFLHGLAYSLLMLVLVFVWALILLILTMLGAIIGLIIGVILLFFIMGFLNSFLTLYIWSIPVKMQLTSLLGHGFLLFIALIVVNVPAMMINLSVPGLATSIVLFIAYAFIDGFVSKYVALIWREEDEEDEE